jgi:hypothetical protein
MIVYREQRRRIATAEACERVRNATGMDRLIEMGELEAGVADALCPVRDVDLPVLQRLRRGEAEPGELPREIEISVPEGFAYYALDPELYRIAARRYMAERHPARVAVIGIRSIGATLGAVVEAELGERDCDTRFWTVRPRGHPWDRRLEVADDLAQTWRLWQGDFAVVDEGPGLSGTSFASVAEFLSRMGISDERIVFFPSWRPDAQALVSERARSRWPRHRMFVAEFEELGVFGQCRDLSGGKWRALTGHWPAVQPQHERRKYLRDGDLCKFAGYGRYGRAKRERAAALGHAEPELCHGFLWTPWIAGRPAALSAGLIDFAACYLARVRREFSTHRAPAYTPLAEMIAVNVPSAPDLSGWRTAVEDGLETALDARMLRHEWLETPHGFVKTDALEHHDDHFFPGPQDTAWDLAGFSLEFGLDASGESLLLERYARASGDRKAASRLPFYRLAYLAFRLGYAELAIQALGECEESERFRGDRARYASLVEREIRHE